VGGKIIDFHPPQTFQNDIPLANPSQLVPVSGHSRSHASASDRSFRIGGRIAKLRDVAALRGIELSVQVEGKNGGIHDPIVARPTRAQNLLLLSPISVYFLSGLSHDPAGAAALARVFPRRREVAQTPFGILLTRGSATCLLRATPVQGPFFDGWFDCRTGFQLLGSHVDLLLESECGNCE